MDSYETLPADDARADGPTEQELLDAVMQNSELARQAGIVDAPPLPEEEEIVEDPVSEVEEEEPEATDEIDNEDDVEYEEEVDEYEGEDDASTQDPEVYTTEDLDLDAKVLVKIDGEESEVSMGELVKGYTTEQSLSKKGRELGEERKKIEEERIERLGQLDQIAEAGAQLIMGNEQQLAKKYHDIEAKIQEARDNGDTFELSELKDQREQAQQAYWQARKQREGLLKTVEQEKTKVAEEQWAQQIEHFNKTIPDMIPDFTPEVATSIREFAIEEGIDPNILDTITDPTIVKFVDDYRRLKQGVSKGKAKRKAAPVKKVPSKKARPAQERRQEKSSNLRKKVLSGQGSKQEEDDFLRDFASQSLSKLG